MSADPSSVATPKRPRGRPAVAPDRARTRVVRARVSEAQADKFERLGAAQWLRERIDKARE